MRNTISLPGSSFLIHGRKRWFVQFILLVFLIAGSVPTFGQLLVGWNVAGLNGTNNNVEPAYLAPNVISGLITRGPGLVPSTATNSITSTSWTLPVISSVADAIASNDYYSVTLTAGSGYHLAITSMALRVQRSSTGPSNYTLRASTDTFGSDLTTWNIGGSTTAQNIQTPLAIGGTNNVEFRIYGHRAGAGSGTGRIQDGADFGQAGIDLGIFGSTIPVSVMEPEIGVLGTNGLLILDGDATPDVADGTDFGSADVATGLVTRTFGITNSGSLALDISGVTTTGAHAADFMVQSFPSTVSPGTKSNLVIHFNPSGLGLRTATITVNNNDSDEAAYDFAVRGTGTTAPTAGTRYVWTNSPNPEFPFTSWPTAARTIQEAVDAASNGDTIYVTNGVYRNGLNSDSRVSVSKGIALRSINGPEYTIIEGSNLVRCLYVANTNASVDGFTLTRGDLAGGFGIGGAGALIEAGVLRNSIITSNRIYNYRCCVADIAFGYGGGVKLDGSGILENSLVIGNLVYCRGGDGYNIMGSVSQPGFGYAYGGGVYVGSSAAQVRNCTLFGNQAIAITGVDIGAPFVNGFSEAKGGGLYTFTNSPIVNCIIVSNNVSVSNQFSSVAAGTNYFNQYNGNISYSCVNPLPAGAGNINVCPQFVDVAGGNFRIALGSPCINTGTNQAWMTGATDLDGQPRIAYGTVDMGAYEFPADTNPVHYVALNNSSPAYPYATWATAATNIQDAIDAADQGDTVIVSNGVYQTGGRVVSGTLLTNRVVVNKAIAVQSVNGPAVTIIIGRADPISTNGNAAVRCAYIGTNAILSGFTLTNGCTRAAGDAVLEQSGGGAWCVTNAVLSNCVLSGNSAVYGGGTYQGTLNNCTISGNSASIIGGGCTQNGTLNYCIVSGNKAFNGGGSAYSTLNNCIVYGNSASIGGGGAVGSLLNSCTLSSNSANNAGGAYNSTLKNCILYFNTAVINSNYDVCTFTYSCTLPNPGGAGNITNDPQFVNAAAGNYRLIQTSPCINAGTNQAWMIGATDLDGNPRILGERVDMGAYEQVPVPWINEVNYDPPGTDANEYVEVAGLAGEDLTSYRLVLYNGGNSLVYNTFTLSGTIDDEGCGYGAVSFDTESIQNGAPDGVALAKVVAGVTSLVHFLSYEGSMTAVGGPADGVTASSIGTQTDDANTLQLQGSGTNYADYTWALNTSSKGTLNAGQSISGCTPVIPTNIAFVSAGSSVSETDGAVTVVVFKTSSSGAVSAQISLSGTATQGVDYTISTTNINLSGATTSQTIVITLINDAVVESEEIVVMTLMNVVGGNLVSPGAYSLTITDTDMLEANPGQLVVYRFNAPRYLPPTAVATGLLATPVSISFGFVQTNVTTGTYFPDEPYIEEDSGWQSGSQSNARSFLFTITPDAGKSLTITGISFRAYATFAGPSAISYDIAGGLATHTVNAPDSALVVVSQAVVGVSSVTNPILIQIQGWTNGSRVTSGSGIFKLDDVVLYGTVGELTAPEISVLSQDGILINDGDSTPSPIDGTDFGDVGVRGYESTRSFKITNSGPDVLILGQVFFSGAHTSDYTTAHAPTNLAPGSSTLLSITFNPTAAGLRTATVNIPNNDGDENPYNFNVQGTGAMAGFGSSPTSLVFTTTQGTNPDPQLLNLMNVGDDLLYYTITTNQPWLLTVPRTGTLSVANSANISVLVLAGSLSTGSYQGMLTFTDAGASNSPYHVVVQLEVQAPTPIIRYVWTNSPSPTAPYTNWQTAARTIQDAVNVAVNGDTVLVTNGLYSSGQQLVNGEPFRLVVTNHVHVKSVNGPVVTVIDGNQSIRVVYISNPDSVVEGFTITGGYGYSGSSAGGGGVTILAGAVIKSIISSNRVYVSQSTAGATGYGFGGGIIMGGGSRLENCLVAYNRLDAIGGSWNPTLFIPAGSGWAEGGGIYAGPSGVVDIVNCTIVENVAYAGHGFHNFPNYQFVNVVRGGGVYANTNANVLLINTIIYSNKLTTGSNGGDSQGFNYFGGNYLYCLSSPLATGTGNTSDSPIFFNHAAGDFRLAAGSPGINEGTNQLWMTIATDLDGNPRIFNDAVDMGAYENLTLVNTLTILGNPEPHGVSSPYNYGVHVLASGITITNTVVSPADESPGQRFVASGWTGIGSLPTSGVGTVVSFTLTNDTTLTWKWTRQFALVQSSTLAGAISVTTNWWGEGDVANTVLAPLVATGSLYYFAEWRDAGQRLPDNTSPASNPAGILMNTARTAVAVYYLEGVDSNGDGLEDWFQRRHFGTNTPSANADVDLDGQTNKEEQEADTNPNNPGSVFKMHRITSSGVQTNFEIRINTQPYRKYTIEFSDVNLAAGGGWRTFSNLANGVGTWVDLSFSSNSFTFIDNFSTNTSGYPPTNGLRHYRIRVADAPFITFYRDSDGDGYGWSAMQISAPLAPTGYVAIAGDCNDNAPTTYPGALELCGNGADDDCDGQTDEVSLDDGVSCTIDSCVDGVVVHTPNDSLCDDGNPCTIETCDPLIGCVQTSALGCFAWSPALNCMEIKANNPAAPSGLYWIDPDGAGTNAPFEIYCDMTSE